MLFSTYKVYRPVGFILMLLLGLVLSLSVADQAVSNETVAISTVQLKETQEERAKQAEKRGVIAYESDHYRDAISNWQTALASYHTQGNTVDQGRIHNLLALAYQQLGLWPEAYQSLEAALASLPDNLLTDSDNQSLQVYAQNLTNRGSLQFSQGQIEHALDNWQQAEEVYLKLQDFTGEIRSQINQAQALQALGFYQRATVQLQAVSTALNQEPASLLHVTALRRLGYLYFLLGQLETSQQLVEQGLTMATTLHADKEIAEMLTLLGNISEENNQLDTALDFYHQAAKFQMSPNLAIRNQLAQLNVWVTQTKWEEIDQTWPQIQKDLDKAVPGRTSIYNRIYFAKTLLKLTKNDPDKTPLNLDRMDIAQVLLPAIQQAQLLEDRRAESYSVGFLAKVYEQSQQWTYAYQLTEQALTLAQAGHAADIEYQWQWQLARLLKVQGKTSEAAVHYDQSIELLNSLRGDLVAIGSEVQFSFRENVEPIYREFVSLLLQPQSTKLVSQENLEQARDIIESLQLAELDNFFKEACLDTVPVRIDQIDEQAAIIYPMLLGDHLDIILRLPHQPLSHFSVRVSDRDVDESVEQLRNTLVIRSRRQYLTPAQQLYDWIIRPIAADLENSQVRTLVFVPDGSLRNVPMSVLHNGDHFLIEDFSIGLTPGLKLISPQTLHQENIKVLVAGLTEARQGFSPLDYVVDEVQAIKNNVKRGEILLDQSFTRTALKDKLAAQSFPVVHVATHGKFSSKAEDTFLLAWDNRINVTDLDQTLQASLSLGKQAIELLVLSACETAAGDNRAALGLAGTAISAGARSTLATLWAINDQATAHLIGNFYAALTQPNTTRATALRQAQLEFLKDPRYRHPIYWAPYVLVGNWL
ncbi:MAG: CHAT domain-containing protein [Cyanobacteria bacterium P01_D01_bin.56]